MNKLLITKFIKLYCTKTMIFGLSGIGTIPIHYTMTESNPNIVSSINFGIRRGLILMTPVISEYIMYKEYFDIKNNQKFKKEINKKSISQKRINETKIISVLNKFKENYYDIDDDIDDDKSI